MKSGLKVFIVSLLESSRLVAVNAAMKSGLKDSDIRMRIPSCLVAVNAAMKSGLKDVTYMMIPSSLYSSSECRDEKRTERLEDVQAHWRTCVAVNAAMKSGLKES